MATRETAPSASIGLMDRFREDIQSVFSRDPAARNVWEVLTCYPGLHAIWFHRLIHALWQNRFFWLARWLSNLNRWLTGIEIHPAATIGRRFFIDHGMGVVIGETAVVGDDVLMYKGAVLGGTSLAKQKRHPTVADGVVIGSNAVILGDILVGAGAKIGSGAVVVKPVPPGATVVGVPGRVIRGPGAIERRIDLNHANMPDPVAEAMRVLLDHVETIEQRILHVEETCNRMQVWKQEDLDALDSSREYLRSRWSDANGGAEQDRADGERSSHGDNLGQTRGT